MLSGDSKAAVAFERVEGRPSARGSSSSEEAARQAAARSTTGLLRHHRLDLPADSIPRLDSFALTIIKCTPLLLSQLVV